MSIVIFKHDANRIADIYQLICQELLFPGVSREQAEQVMEVITRLRRSPEDLRIDCKFAVEPALRQLQVLITTRAVDAPKVEEAK